MQAKRTILIVDDEKWVRDVFRDFCDLTDAFAIDFARDGNEAVAMVRDNSYDLITLDLIMPEMTGWEALKVFKETRDLRDIPVVIVSVVAGEQVEERDAQRVRVAEDERRLLRGRMMLCRKTRVVPIECVARGYITADVIDECNGLEALYPKPNLSKPVIGHKIYPQLLKGVRIDRADQVWSTDISVLQQRRA